MRVFPATLFGLPVPQLRPIYRRRTVLDTVRAERRMRGYREQFEKMLSDLTADCDGVYGGESSRLGRMH